jgi:hypothetical protein
MRRRVSLVLWSLLTIAALACGGWLLDPAGSRQPVGSARQAQDHPTRSGSALFADVSRAMVAERTVTYTYSGSSGGGETQSGSGAMRFLPGEDAKTFDADVMVTSPTTGRMRAVLLPGAAYLALPPAKGLPKSKPWLKVTEAPRTELGQKLRPVADQMRAAFDPGQCLGLLRAAGGVLEVGPDTVEGVPTTRHRATVNLRRAARLVEDPAAREQYRAMLAAGIDSLVYELWLDSKGLPRKIRAAVPTAQGLFSVTGVYRRWGDPVRIKAPRAKQVFDADSIRG